jgi:hypothetical protein
MNNTINLDCQLADQLDSSVQNSMGIQGGTSKNDGELFYNTSNGIYANAEGDNKISPEMIQAGLATTTAIVSGISKNRASQGVCKKPLIRETPLNRRKWADYRACLDREAKAQAQAVAKAEAEARAKEAEAQAQYANRGGSGDDSDDKILGMPKGLAIGIGVTLGLVIVGFVGYKIVKAKQG